MNEVGKVRPKPRQLTELADVYELLEEVRLRPGMWIRRGSLLDLDSMLRGYWIALEIHRVEEDFAFKQTGTFSAWLWPRLGMAYESALGWAVEIERAAETAGRPAIELFFELLDEFRAETSTGDSSSPA